MLVIDEISMLSADILSKLDEVARTVRKRKHLPFGGIQLIACGDFFQLPPVPDVTPCPRCGDTHRKNRTVADVAKGRGRGTGYRVQFPPL